MANYIKGNGVANATSYTLHKQSSTDSAIVDAAIATQTVSAGGAISFNLDELVEAGTLGGGSYQFAVKAHADGYLSSEYSALSEPEFVVEMDDVALAYIESTGTQYIDTGIAYNDTINVKMGIKATKDDYTDPEAIMGVSWETNGFFSLFHNNKVKFHNYGSGGAFSSNVDIFNDTLSLDITASALIVNGETLKASGSSTNRTTNIFLFDAPGTNAARKQGSFKLYYCQIYKDGSLVRDFVPYMKDGVVGLLDNISGEFFTNSGTGEFIGEAASEGALTYIESTGTQAINTGINYMDNIKVDLAIATTKSDYSTAEAIMGAQWTVDGFFLLFQSNKLKYHTKSASTSTSLFSTSTDIFGEQLQLMVTRDAVTINGAETITPTGGTATANQALPIYLFDAPGTNAARKQGSFKLYYCKMYYGETLVRDFIPYRNSVGDIGLYDNVSKTFFSNTGTSSFVGA